MLAAPLRKASYEEYLALERDSETKHEYVNGEIYATAGGTLEHGRLATKVAQLVRNADVTLSVDELHASALEAG